MAVYVVVGVVVILLAIVAIGGLLLSFVAEATSALDDERD